MARQVAHGLRRAQLRCLSGLPQRRGDALGDPAFGAGQGKPGLRAAAVDASQPGTMETGYHEELADEDHAQQPPAHRRAGCHPA